MRPGFEMHRAAEGVYHIRDAMGVCVTLLAGSRASLLVDTAYGIGDLRGFIAPLSEREPRVVLTHGHHDHALGAMHFEEAALLPADREVYREYTCPERRRTVLMQAEQRGICLDAEEKRRFLSLPMAAVRDAGEEEIDLGGMTVRPIPCPGHTPGSLVLYVPERRLLLPGDNYNPTTWVFFHESMGPRTWRENMRGLFSLPFEGVLCPHDPRPQPRRRMEDFFAAVGDEALAQARPTPAGEGAGVETRQVAMPDGQVFVFSWQKYLRGL